MSSFSISRLCSPASLYFWVAVISLVIAFLGNRNVSSSLVSLVFIVFWTWCLNMLCSKGYKTVSWVLVLLPFFYMAYLAMTINRSSFLL